MSARTASNPKNQIHSFGGTGLAGARPSGPPAFALKSGGCLDSVTLLAAWIFTEIASAVDRTNLNCIG
jgi:hypothetical protein